ncbi:protein DBF4 homolog A [Sphaeramia orbicularis]|uniref:protein DBF4 homolog A n=1 Tax=Sphaeramia orbicularis TaxID=375764 RepID=UPI00118169BA|nr:protein DBF4 homolog A [Sphaeramia orbicularis]
MKENKMKPRRTQRHIEPSWKGNITNTGDKATVSQAKPSSCVSCPVEAAPFAGKVFYLDLPSNRMAQTLERDIQDLGGIVEKFFSKEIKYLVSNKMEAKYVHRLRQDSPVPSPESGPSSPHPYSNPHQPASHGDVKSRFQGQTDSVLPFSTSRGKSLVKRVVKEQKRVHMDKILSNALDWGVKILYVDDMIRNVQKKKKLCSQFPATTVVKTVVNAQSSAKHGFQKVKGERISKPFVKVEDSSRRYRPVYLSMSSMPEFNLKTIPPCTPFCVDQKGPPGSKQQGCRGASDKRANGQKKIRGKNRQGFCECCELTYDNLTTHLQSERHKAFSKSDEYLVVDRLVSNMHCNLIHIKSKMKSKPKCSVSSVVISPGPCGKTKPKHKGDGDTTETIKEEQLINHTDEGHGKYQIAHALKITSDSGPAPLHHTEGNRRYCRTYSNTSKHRSLGRKRPCGQNWTSCYQADQDRTPQFKEETAPSRGECVASNQPFPPGVTPVDLWGPICQTDIDRSATNTHDMNTQKEASSKSLNVMTKQESPKRQDTSLCDMKRSGNVKMTENSLSEKETGLQPQDFSPVRRIQRRVRVYKRKRRKVDAQVFCQEHVQLNDSADNSLLRLWELFQSSDDMDVEFLGFED